MSLSVIQLNEILLTGLPRAEELGLRVEAAHEGNCKIVLPQSKKI